MLKDAPIIIFDEATAYLDPENESLIQEAISKLVQGKTLIMVAHRLYTVTGADQLVVVNQGSIRKCGKPILGAAMKEVQQHDYCLKENICFFWPLERGFEKVSGVQLAALNL